MRNRMQRLLIAASGVLILVFIISGCATIERTSAKDDESKLAAAGFKIKIGDTPEKLAQINAMPQRTFTVEKSENGLHWNYADADFCRCLYTGDESAYQRYQELAVRERIAETNRQAALDMDTFGWGPNPWRRGTWGPGFWGPGYW